MKEFLYLLQGRAENVPEYFHLAERPDADAIFLTWDKPADGAYFFPNSTWTQGRNRLLELALERDPYQYYIFSDDDVSFVSGSWESFEASLLKYRPAIGAPVMPRVAGSKKIPFVECQAFVVTDEQLLAFHRNVVLDRIVLPYVERFDRLTPYAACEIQEILTRNFYWGRAVRFNNIRIENLNHDTGYFSEEDFRSMLWDWLRTQFRNDIEIKRVWLGYREKFFYEFIYTMIFYLNLAFFNNCAPVKRRKKRRILEEKSAIYDSSIG